MQISAELGETTAKKRKDGGECSSYGVKLVGGLFLCRGEYNNVTHFGSQREKKCIYFHEMNQFIKGWLPNRKAAEITVQALVLEVNSALHLVFNSLYLIYGGFSVTDFDNHKSITSSNS